MTNPESLREIAQSRTPFSTWLGVVLLFVLFGVIVWAVIGPTTRTDTYEQKRAEQREKKLKDLREQDFKALTTYGWVDKAKGVVRIPIERAMQISVTELAAKKPAPAGPIATPTPQPAAVPAGAAAPVTGATAAPQPSATAKPASQNGPNSEIRGQPTGAANPAPAQPGTQPGAAATPAASPQPVAVPPVSPTPSNLATPPGPPLPVRGKSPGGS